jgi:hypothetical protein
MSRPMPDVHTDDARRGGRLLTLLFWAGVGLAPLAGLVLLLSGDGPMPRVAAVLALLAVVLIGLSIALRPDAGQIRQEVEDMVLDEVEMLREDVRGDISSATRQTHQVLAERVQQLQQTVDALRAELEAVRASGVGFGIGHAAAAPVAPHPPVQAHAAVPPPVAAAAAPVAPAGAAPVDPVSGVPERPRASAAGRAHVPSGVVRHTETVHHVTTRSTFVGHHGDDDGHSAPYGGGYVPRRAEHTERAEPAEPRTDWSPPAPRRPADEPEEESWTDRKLRERYGRPSRAHSRAEPADEEPWAARSARRGRWSDDEPAAGSGDLLDGGAAPARWASRHTDDRGEELRLGERRAAMRSNESGTEMRIEDRWAAVRRNWDRDDPGPDSRRGWDWDGPLSDDRDEDGAGRRGRRALPAASDAPSWNSAWDEPEREPRGRRHRPDDDDVGYSPGQRRFEFELSDERWR